MKTLTPVPSHSACAALHPLDALSAAATGPNHTLPVPGSRGFSSGTASSMSAAAEPPVSLEALRGQSCQGMCGPGTSAVPRETLPRYLALLPAWTLEREGRAISRCFTARNFKAGEWLAGSGKAEQVGKCVRALLLCRPGQPAALFRRPAHPPPTPLHPACALPGPSPAAAMAFLNAVAELAEAEGHHPDVHLTNASAPTTPHPQNRILRSAAAFQRARPTAHPSSAACGRRS